MNSSTTKQKDDQNMLRVDKERGGEVKPSYCDYSKVDAKTANDESFWARQRIATKVPPFPATLHMMVSDPQNEDQITWLPHGRAWKIVDKAAFEKDVLPQYFRHGQMSSFTRQLRGYGFQKISSGVDVGSYYHELFLRGMPHLCQSIKRSANKHTSINKNKKDLAPPDFYRMSRDNPLPDDPRVQMKKESRTASSISSNESNKQPAKTQSQHVQHASEAFNFVDINNPEQSSQQLMFSNTGASTLMDNARPLHLSDAGNNAGHCAFTNNYVSNNSKPNINNAATSVNISGTNHSFIENLLSGNCMSSNSLVQSSEPSLSLNQPNTRVSTDQVDLQSVRRLIALLGTASNNAGNQNLATPLIQNPVINLNQNLPAQLPVSNRSHQQPFEILNNLVSNGSTSQSGTGVGLPSTQQASDAGALSSLIGNVVNLLGQQLVSSTRNQTINTNIHPTNVGSMSTVNTSLLPPAQVQTPNPGLQLIQQLLISSLQGTNNSPNQNNTSTTQRNSLP